MTKQELEVFLEKYSIKVKNQKEHPNFVLYNLDECPFCNGAHKDGAYVMCFHNGTVIAKCHHETCKEASWAKLYENLTGKKLASKKDNNKDKKGTSESVIDAINQMVDEGLLELFLDNYQNLVARVISIDRTIMKTMPVKSYTFKIHFQQLIYEKINNVLDKRSLETVYDYLGVLAYKNEKRINVYKRIYYSNDKIIYELDKDKNLTVVISKEGINVTDEEDVFFHHSKYYANQVIPKLESIDNVEHKTLLKLIKKHFNLKGDDCLLFAIYLVSSFLGKGICHPIMSISGQKGSGKSSAIRKFCRLVDPKSIDLGNIPKNEDDLSLKISENYVNSFDNLSYISKSISDLFCKCVTGGTNVRRTLYENSDETTFDLKSIVVLNGIDVIISESDLLDRTVFFHLERLGSDELRTEAELDGEFEKDIPVILALCFSILQLAMTDDVPVDKSAMIRLADFYEWSIRIGRALGYKDETIIKLLQKNQDLVNEQALAENPLAQILLVYMEYVEERTHSVSELLKILKKLALEQQIDVKLLPKQPNVLSRKLNQIKSNLERVGLTYKIESKEHNKEITLINARPKRVPIKI